MVGDGNCLFRALSYPRVGTHATLRADVAAHVGRNWSTYRPFVDSPRRTTYVRDLARLGTWGDELVLHAYADMHPEERVLVHTDAGVVTYGAGPRAHRLRFRDGHYDVIIGC